MRIRLNQGLLAGFFLTGTGLVFAVASLNFHLGTPMNMGPGFFPLVVSILLTVLGIVALIPAIRKGEPVPRPRVRQLVAVIAALMAFALMIRPFGLLPSVAAVILIAAFADENSRLWQTLLLAVGICAGCWFIFLFGLQLNIPAIRLSW